MKFATLLSLFAHSHLKSAVSDGIFFTEEGEKKAKEFVEKISKCLERGEKEFSGIIKPQINAECGIIGCPDKQELMLVLDRYNVPILAMTANAFDEDRINAFKTGKNGHITKPINVPDLIKTLGEVLK